MDPKLFTNLVEKTSDLDWFMFENKVRSIIQELIEPVLVKSEFINTKSENLNIDVEVLMRQADEIQFALNKLQH